MVLSVYHSLLIVEPLMDCSMFSGIGWLTCLSQCVDSWSQLE